jgi:hypothetical protein
MNFARVICDRRAAQSIMRNIAFALQARNQHASVRCLNVCRYRRATALKSVLKARSPNRIDRVDRRESFSEKSTAVSARPPTSRLCNMIASSTVQENWPLAIDHVGLRAAEGNASPSIRPEGNDPVRFGLAGNFDFRTLRTSAINSKK